MDVINFDVSVKKSHCLVFRVCVSASVPVTFDIDRRDFDQRLNLSVEYVTRECLGKNCLFTKLLTRCETTHCLVIGLQHASG